jgi:excisionase family DNA binding protein
MKFHSPPTQKDLCVGASILDDYVVGGLDAPDLLKAIAAYDPAAPERTEEPLPEMVDIPAAAKALKVSRDTIRRMCKDKRMASARIGNQIRIRVAELRRLSQGERDD